ncbi:MAG: hypothetical protein HQK75_15720 [Candidatus Magnetomorum sp.]|nr:hypothetical protein [Candidatus Magnetomorum sp.]
MNTSHQEVWKALHELIEANKETGQQLKETDRQLNEQMKKTDKKIEQVGKNIDKLQRFVGGIGNSNGYVAEDLFFSSLSKKMAIGNITFDSIDRNIMRIHKGLQDEFDVVLTNSDKLVIVEIKYNFHPNDVETVLKKIDNFRKLFPPYHNYQIFGAVAGLTMPQKTIDTARKYGFFVLTQEGNNLKVLNDDVMAYFDNQRRILSKE